MTAGLRYVCAYITLSALSGKMLEIIKRARGNVRMSMNRRDHLFHVILEIQRLHLLLVKLVSSRRRDCTAKEGAR